MARYTFIDLFCGAGGLSLGFQQEGFECVLAMDKNPSAVKTYRRNLGNHGKTIQITEETQLPEVDLIIGGPPCQGFSSAGLRRSNDRRNTLVRVFAQLIARNRPRAFVFENVEGILTAERGDRIVDLLEPVIEAGYRVHLRKVNAANYGIPQHRKRVICVGGLGYEPTFPKPTHRAFGAPGASIACRHLPACPTFLEAISSLPAPALQSPGAPVGHFIRPLSDDDAERVRLLEPGQRMRDLPERLWHSTYRKRAFRRVMDGTPSERRGGAPAGIRRLKCEAPCKAVTSGAISEFVHPLEDRFITLRECARVQTFPDTFIFEGSVSQMMLQVGNAVPPRLGQAIAEAVREDLGRTSTENGRGELVSFVPTQSSGMSPALADVCARVRNHFWRGEASMLEQLQLWP